MIKISKIISPSFYNLFRQLQGNNYTHHILKGGRGSTKSSFISIYIILDIMQDEKANALILRNTGNTLQDSVYNQLRWAINALGVEGYWRGTVNPLKLIYTPTGQQILFRGADDPLKIKSIKTTEGYIKLCWYEEWHEFSGMEVVRNINQSIMRGGDDFTVFYSFNPPKSKNSWVNEESETDRKDRVVHHSTYLDVPKDWLGSTFFIEADYLKSSKPLAYEHEYMGLAIGFGGDIFDNISKQTITNEQIKTFDKINYGLDFGYTIDPFAFVSCCYDKTRKKLFIFDEIYETGLSNRKASEKMKKKLVSRDYIVADSAEPKSIDEIKSYDLRIKGAKKGPDSIEYGIKFLQSLEEIIIDPIRCPNTYKEFVGYEYLQDKNGKFINRYPDINNHSIDATRYAIEDHTRTIKAKVISKDIFGGML